MEQLTKHFNSADTECHCGCGYNAPSSKLLNLAEKIRNLLELPMIVHCVCRCQRHNKAVSGSGTSQHLYGRAMDFHVKSISDHAHVCRIIKQAYDNGDLPELGGLGLYDWGIHIDCRDTSQLKYWDSRKF